ncbi:AraC family transcriptional regulator [Flavobacterium sp. J27]|uniref:AraC family transcriptional regulator n=1 Tax=Flavobacterium sp. J27 TaxID=2060419 RepID=UPI00102F39F9|nr:AraC family transcriptional regulator [Flavobacterium sp. J27]
MFFDNLEYISIENQTTDFPKHFHETFCISLIHNGIEQIEFENHSLFSEKGSISITNPYEIHANPLIDKHNNLKFDTIYLSKDLMKYLLNGKNITFFDRKINNENTNLLFLELKKAMNIGNPEIIAFFLKKFVKAIQLHSLENENDYPENLFSDFNEINQYIEDHINHKFCLNELSKMANINKYGFVKKFKASTGMTPMNYILMKKIFSSKMYITPTSELTELAYEYNFADLAHFSKTFKRFIGISPKKYQENLIKI